jgi:hypothetical protein
LAIARACGILAKKVELSAQLREISAAFMNLDESQRKKVGEWVRQGLKLSEIQNRLAAELGVRLTYMDVRLLVDDLKLVPKDVERPKTVGTLAGPGPAPSPEAKTGVVKPPGAATPAAEPEPALGEVSISVDQLARPGAVVSGKVTFSDGNQAEWYFDQAGRLGLVPQKPGYRPSAADLQQFQMTLESELSRMGM